jgi:preprotein translocase subunit SecG
MKATDVMTLILFVVFAGCVGALVVFWHYGNLDYETSAAPQVLKNLGSFLRENQVVVYVSIILAILFLGFVLVFRIYKRIKRIEMNTKVVREMDQKFAIQQ